jgi:hypothetical protein
MLRVLAVLVALVVIVFVAASVANTLFSLALAALIVGALLAGLGVFRLGQRSAHRPRNRF